jgi:hypothetical protein
MCEQYFNIISLTMGCGHSSGFIFPPESEMKKMGETIACIATCNHCKALIPIIAKDHRTEHTQRDYDPTISEQSNTIDGDLSHMCDKWANDPARLSWHVLTDDEYRQVQKGEMFLVLFKAEARDIKKHM